MSVYASHCPEIVCHAPGWIVTARATVASPAGIAKVDFFLFLDFLEPQVQTSIDAPYGATFYVRCGVVLCRVSGVVSATVTDVDGNIATHTATVP
jgi:hypothetical protein